MHKRVIVPSESSSDILYASNTYLEKGFFPSPHKHPNLEIIYFYEGKGFVQSTNRKIEVRQGDLMIINKDVRHFEASEDYSLKFYAIGINELEAYLEKKLEKKILYFSIDEPHDIFYLFEKIYEEIDLKKEEYLSAVDSLLHYLFLTIKRYRPISFNQMKRENHSSLVASCLLILDNHFFENLDVNTLAKRLSVSSSYLSHLFKKEMGVSIIQYKIRKQLEEASNLLKITDLPIGDIAFQVGINDLSYFAKQYKKMYGNIPGEERKSEI